MSKRNIDYKLCSLEQLVDYIIESPVSRITQQLMYYRKECNKEMVDKITKARLIAKSMKLQEKIDAL